MLKIIDDYKPTLEELQKMVGGHMEIMSLSNGDSLVINENGRMDNLNRKILKHNPEATIIYHKNGGMRNMNIVGMAVLVKRGLLK